MSKITVKTKLTTVQFTNAADAAEFVAALEHGKRSSSRSREPREGRVTWPDEIKRTISLLEILVQAGGNGVTSEDLARMVAVKGPRWLPSISAPAKRHLAAVNEEFDQVVHIIRTGLGTRWVVEKATAERVIAVLKAEIEG